MDHRRRQHDQRLQGRSGQGHQQRVRPGGRGQDGRLPGRVRTGARRRHQRHHEVGRQRLPRRRRSLYYDSTGTAAEKEFRPGDSGIAQMRVVDGNRFDYGADLGGFLLKDRLWFFGAYNRVTLGSEVSRLQPSTFVSTDVRFPLDATSDLYSGKLTWNLAGTTTVVGTVFADPSTSSGAAGADPRQGLGVSQVTPPVSLDRFDLVLRAVSGRDGLRHPGDPPLRLARDRDSSGLVPQGPQRPHGAADGIRYMDQTCAGGTPESRAIARRRPTPSRAGTASSSGSMTTARRVASSTPPASRCTRATTRSRREATTRTAGPTHWASTPEARSSGSETNWASSTTPTASSR